MNNQREQIIKVLTISAVIFMVMLFCAMIINLITLAQKNSEEKRLQAELNHLSEIIRRNDEEIAYKDADDYIEKFARDTQQFKRKDETTFVGKRDD